MKTILSQIFFRGNTLNTLIEEYQNYDIKNQLRYLPSLVFSMQSLKLIVEYSTSLHVTMTLSKDRYPTTIHNPFNIVLLCISEQSLMSCWNLFRLRHFWAFLSWFSHHGIIDRYNPDGVFHFYSDSVTTRKSSLTSEKYSPILSNHFS